MRIIGRIILPFCLLLCSGLVFSAGLLPALSANSQAENSISVPSDLTPEQVGDFVAPLDEQQVRNLLIDNLKTEASANQVVDQEQSVSIIKLLKGINNPYTPLGGGLAAMSAAAGNYFDHVSEVINTMTDGNGIQGFIKLVGLLALVITGAWLIEFVCLYKWREKKAPEVNLDEPEGWEVKFKHPFLRFLLNFIGLAIFAVAGYLIATLFLSENTNSFAVLMRLFDAVIVYRFFIIVFRVLMNSPPEGLDLIDDTINKPMLMRCIAIFLFLFYIVADGFFNTMYTYGLSDAHYVLSAAVMFGLIINPLIIGAVWWARYDIDRILFGTVDEKVCKESGYRYAARAAIWPTVVTVVLLLVFCLWQILVITGNTQDQKEVEQAWWLVILFPLVDLVVASLLYKLTSMPVFQHARFQQRKYRVTYIIRNVVRLVLIAALTLNILDALNIDILERLGAGDKDIVRVMTDIGITVVIGFIIWEAIQLWIEHKLPDEPEDGVVEIEGEGGGAAATRTETLLPLLRTTLLIVLFLVVIMSVLYSLGVQIAPLLAGAGVVGIAVGFGSQKLVQDIISGVFFLIDDAFRKGEYVEVAGMRGTVEKLSVRSMRLRHHLGSVQTIPYGEIATVKNQSRDWVIMKLELRLPYDVDIEKVRKIIKKVGQEMLEDEEIGPNMLQPLKSQGVMRVEESALIIRMKFTAKPGEQWIIRRVAYTRVRDALAAQGIEFAHREVKVRLPQELEHLQKMDYERKLHLKDKEENSENAEEQAPVAPAAVAAAAMSAVVAKELAAQDKIDDNGDEGSDDR